MATFPGFAATPAPQLVIHRVLSSHDGKQDEEPFLLTMPDRTEAVAAEDPPLDQGEKLFNLADEYGLPGVMTTEVGAPA